MPAKLPTHKPATVATDAPAKGREQARRAARYLPYSGKQWQCIRRAQLERFPLCEDCDRPANEVDHNTNDTSRNLIGIELSSLCHPCHSKRTRARELGRDKPQVYGCDVNGNPLDPDHHWNNERSLGSEDHSTARPGSHARPQLGGSDDE